MSTDNGEFGRMNHSVLMIERIENGDAVMTFSEGGSGQVRIPEDRLEDGVEQGDFMTVDFRFDPIVTYQKQEEAFK